MQALGRSLIFALALSIAGCGNNARKNAEKTLHSVGPTALRADAARFYKELFVSPERRYFIPKLEDCPLSIQRFQPLRVRVYSDGFAIALNEVSNVEEGLYVVPQGMETTPRASRSAQFEKIADGIFWFSFTE